MNKVLVDRGRVVESMCLTWRHDFGLDKLEGCDFCSGMTDKEREHLRGQMGKLFDHHFAPAMAAVTAERDRLRDAAGKAIAWFDAEQNESGVGINRRIKLCRDAEDSLRAAMSAKEA